MFRGLPHYSKTNRPLSVAAALLVGFGMLLGPNLTSAHADELDDQYSALQSQIAESQTSVDGSQSALDAANATLQQSQVELGEAIAAQQAADQAVAEAQARDAETQAALQVAQRELAAGKAAVDAAQGEADRQTQALGEAVRMQAQQNSAMLGVGMLFTNMNTGDIGSRVQLAGTVINATGNQLAIQQVALAELQAQRDALSVVEDAAQQAKDAALAQLEITQQAATAAAEAAARVAALVTENQSAMAAAQSLLNEAVANNQSLRDQAADLANRISARDAAAAAAADEARQRAAAAAAASSTSWLTTNIAPGQLYPASVEAAVARAQAMDGNMNYGNMCLALVATFYGYSSSGVASATAAANMIMAAGQMQYDLSNIPVGALIWYDGDPVGNPFGHVAMYAGDGMVYSNGAANGGVGLMSITTPSAGWGEPIIGWSSVWLPYATG